MFDYYSLALPYPQLEGEINQKELLSLYDLCSGRFSKMSSICSYLYQSIISDEQVKELFAGIANSEMHHLSLLLNAIKHFGGNPIFAGKHNYFSGSYVNYENDLKQVFFDNVYLKRQSVKILTNLSANTNNGSFCNLLTRIAMDEQLHEQLLINAYISIFSGNEEDFSE